VRYVLLIYVLFFSFNIFGQQNNFGTELGEYEIIKNHPNAKGLNMIFKSPLGYNEMNPKGSNTIKLYSSGNSSLSDREIILQVFDYKTYFPEGVYINNSSIFEMINLLKKESLFTNYFSIQNYPGYIFQKTDGEYTSLQINIFLKDVFFVISFTSVYLIGPSDIEYIKKIAKSVEFLSN
tara:strand:- start:584 stop:1120 length:537 start_codon:yes stop_codon:yes gene_type:complete